MPTEGKEPKRRQNIRNPLIHSLRNSIKTLNLKHWYIYLDIFREPDTEPCKLYVYCFSLCELMNSFDLDGLLSWCSPSSLNLVIFLPPLQQNSLIAERQYLTETSFLELFVPWSLSLSLCIVLDHGSLYLFLTAALVGFSDDIQIRHWYMSRAEYH